MLYLVDGNNVMAQTVGWHRDKSGARRRLVRDLVGFVAAHRTKVTVVFDGPADSDCPDGTVFKSVRVLYAKPGSDADSRIKDIVSKSSFKRDVVVVTSDKALGSFVKRLGTKITASGEFRRMLQDSMNASVEAEKQGTTETVDVEEWMEYFHQSDN